MEVTSINDKVDNFIKYKRSLGYVYATQERYLRHYKKHMNEFYPNLEIPTKESTNHFLDNYQGQTGGLYNAMGPLREFSRYLLRLGYQNTYLIPPKQMPSLHPEPPYFFSVEELAAFFIECDIYYDEDRGPGTRGIVIPAELRLLYCCGLRPKEVRILPTKDVHLEQKYIDVTQSKGPKSRRIYISEELASYLIHYNYKISAIYEDRKYFFPSSCEEPYSVNTLRYNFRVIWKRCFPEWTGKLPRLYDFRHHFAWANINQWARENVDVNTMLPYLMRYMGHTCIKHSLYYFRFVPDFYSDYNALSNRLNDRIPEVFDE